MTTRIISLHEDDESLPPPTPLPVAARAEPATSPGGVLLVGDHTVVVLTGTALVGRDPQADPRVQRNEAHAVVLVDARSSVSRVHAELRVTPHGVDLIDLGSTNGTLVMRPGEPTGRLLTPHQPALLQPGDVISFGGLQCRFELPHTAGSP